MLYYVNLAEECCIAFNMKVRTFITVKIRFYKEPFKLQKKTFYTLFLTELVLQY